MVEDPVDDIGSRDQARDIHFQVLEVPVDQSQIPVESIVIASSVLDLPDRRRSTGSQPGLVHEEHLPLRLPLLEAHLEGSFLSVGGVLVGYAERFEDFLG